jgi:transposase-like protein
MNIIERAQGFVESLLSLGKRDWRECPYCGRRATRRNGSYLRRPFGDHGRTARRVQRHWCHVCRKTYSEQAPDLIRRGWYTRAVRRKAMEMQVHLGVSTRKTAEWLRAEIGKRGRYLTWHIQASLLLPAEDCRLCVQTLLRWQAQAGKVAAQSVSGQLAGIHSLGEVGVDGLWVRLHDGTKRVVLMLADTVTGLVYPPVVVKEEESAASWGALCAQVERAGLSLQRINGLVSDGAHGLLSYLQQCLPWVHQQRCTWHLWRSAGGRIAAQVRAATAGLEGEAAQQVAQQVRDSLGKTLHAILDASSYAEAERALAQLRLLAWGEALARWLEPLLDAALMYLMPNHQGLSSVSPEWLWRDYRLRSSHGRNHGSELRQAWASLIWAIYHNFEPTQRRSEQKRTYRHPGQSPLEVAGAPPGNLSYLDALGI